MRALRDMQAWPALRLAAVALALALNAVGCGRSELPVVSPPLSDSGCALEPVIQPSLELDSTFLVPRPPTDVVFLLDTTSSMLGFDRITYRLQTEVFLDLLLRVPGAQLGIATFADFPNRIGPPHVPPSKPFWMRQTMTDDLPRLSRVLTRITRQIRDASADRAESQVEALHEIATGAGHPHYVPRAHCPRGYEGYPCFRPDAMRVVLLITDSIYHNGTSGMWPYGDPNAEVTQEPPEPDPPAPTYEQIVPELRSAGVHVLPVAVRVPPPPMVWDEWQRALMADLQTTARDTGVLDDAGEPLVLYWRNEELRSGVGLVDGLASYVARVRMRVRIRLEDVPGDRVDATALVRRVEALGIAPDDAGSREGDHWVDVTPGASLQFRLVVGPDPSGRARPPGPYPVRVAFVGDGAVQLGSVVVDIPWIQPAEPRCE